MKEDTTYYDRSTTLKETIEKVTELVMNDN
jgi:hypothetical protein